MYAAAFNADLSKWDTAQVTTMQDSTSTPLVSVVLSLEFHSPLCFSSSFPQCFGAVASNEHCAAVPGRL
jgi:surface protein